MVTGLSAEKSDARTLYEDEYCARGEMENRIKEQQLYLFADRTSTHSMRSNQLRLWFSSVAYTLLQVIRQFGLQGTKLARARRPTITPRLSIGLKNHPQANRGETCGLGSPWQGLGKHAARHASRVSQNVPALRNPDIVSRGPGGHTIRIASHT